MHETQLANFVKSFGDEAQKLITNTLMHSTLVQLIILIGAMIAIIRIGRGMQTGSVPSNAVMFFAAWLLCFPINGVTVGYRLINTLGLVGTLTLEKGLAKALKGNQGNRSMPPGFVINSLMRASLVEITDPEIHRDVNTIIDNCVPPVSNSRGEPLTVADLFGPKITPSTGGAAESYTEKFDPSLLSARPSGKPKSGGGEYNCYDLLSGTRRALRAHIQTKRLDEMPAKTIVGSNTGDTSPETLETTSSWGTPNSQEASLVRNVALNLATASSIQKSVVERFRNDGMSAGLVSEAMVRSGVVSPDVYAATRNLGRGFSNIGGMISTAAFDIMNLPDAVARALNLDGSIRNASAFREVDAKMRSIPYYTASIQNLLKAIEPFVMLTAMLGTFKIIFSWSAMWLTTMFMPVMANALQAQSNSLIFHASRLNDVAKGILNPVENEAAYLQFGINFQAATAMMDDINRMVSDLLRSQLWALGAVSALFIGTSYFADRLSSKGVEAFAGHIGHIGQRRAAAATIGRTKTTLAKVAGVTGVAATIAKFAVTQKTTKSSTTANGKSANPFQSASPSPNGAAPRDDAGRFREAFTKKHNPKQSGKSGPKTDDSQTQNGEKP